MDNDGIPRPPRDLAMITLTKDGWGDSVTLSIDRLEDLNDARSSIMREIAFVDAAKLLVVDSWLGHRTDGLIAFR